MRFHFLSEFGTTISCLLAVLAMLGLTTIPATGQDSSATSKSEAAAAQFTIPPGTILPVVLKTTIASGSAKQGQVLHAEVAQDVPLPGGAKIRKGSKVQGRVVAVVAAANGHGAKISFCFDKLYDHGQAFSVKTNLRAIAGFMDVLEASTPNQAIGEGDVAEWMTTTQIGGDSVFGLGGVVTSAHNADDVVGKSLMSGGVLAKVRANQTGGCRSSLDGNDRPQALWVFSSDACGTYGLSNISIAHAGRTDPMGTVTLDLHASKAKIHDGAGLLLRVIG